VVLNRGAAPQFHFGYVAVQPAAHLFPCHSIRCTERIRSCQQQHISCSVHVAVQPTVPIRPIPPKALRPQCLFSSSADTARASPLTPPPAARARRQDPVLGTASDMWLAAGCTATYIWWGTVMVPGSPGGMRLARAGLAGQRRRSTPAFQGPTAPLLQLWIARSAHNALRPCFAPAPVLTSS
jgi:hypothetical protein